VNAVTDRTEHRTQKQEEKELRAAIEIEEVDEELSPSY
jgi:hypothetical protein